MLHGKESCYHVSAVTIGEYVSFLLLSASLLLGGGKPYCQSFFSIISKDNKQQSQILYFCFFAIKAMLKFTLRRRRLPLPYHIGESSENESESEPLARDRRKEFKTT
jgi:hypothetical protein